MNRSRSRQVFALILGLFVALGMSASAVQATDMAVKMATASSMGAAGSGTCNGCGDDGSGMKAAGCGIAVCAAPVVAALPQTLSMTQIDLHELPSTAEPLLTGRASSPDPRPPRSTDLG